MKVTPMIFFLCQLPRIILCGGAIWMMHEGVDGWGWLLFVAALLGWSFDDGNGEPKQ